MSTRGTGSEPREGAAGAWHRSPWAIVLVAVVVGLLAGLGGGVWGANMGDGSSPSRSAREHATVCDSRHVAEEVLPSIVTVTLGSGGVGSGEIISPDGYIVTNNHVIQAAATSGDIHVLFSSGHETDAKLVGRDPKSDLAVLKVDADQKLPTIDFGDSEKVSVGQPVVALGAPLGLSSTVTAGIVSALGRNVPVPGDDGDSTVLAGAIQTDAAINPGNSGGALVDCSGHLVGVNTAIATVPNNEGHAGGGSVGIGFAVPANLAKRISHQLIETGSVDYPYFGVAIAPIPHAVAERYGVADGLYVESVVNGGPADKAGLRAGDVVTKIDGRTAGNADVLIQVTLTKKAGDRIRVHYLRDGRERIATVTLGAIP